MKLLKCSVLSLLLFFSFTVNADGISEKLGAIFSSNDPSGVADEILDPEIAFQFLPVVYSDNTLRLEWLIEPGYYLYKDKLGIVADSPDIALGDYQLPAGKTKNDPAFGEVEVYYSGGSTLIPFSLSGVNLTAFAVIVSFQGCKENAVCYPPIKKSYTVNVTAQTNPIEANASQKVVKNNQIKLVSEQDAITQALKNKSLLLNVLAFFGFGFLLALTPCVFPMIPILSGIIVGQGGQITRSRAISLSLSYVFAMALTYSVLGMLAGMFNLNLQAASQNPVVLSVFSLVFVLLALSMFDFYQLQLPASWQSRLTSNNTDSGTLKGAAVMGVLSAIIVGPCVAPPLAGALLYISQTGDVLLGGLALFAMGLGFGVPLLVVGATSGELLPRAGQWMQSIKKVFGVIMLGVAIWFMERVLTASVVLMLWALLFVITAVYMGALDKQDSSTTSWLRFQKGLAVVLLLYGSVLVVGAGIGNGTVLQPIQLAGLAQDNIKSLKFEYISSVEELDIALAQARQNQQQVMLDYYADWCVVCNELEQYTFPDASVQKQLAEFKLLKIDVTQNNDADKRLLKSHELFGPPAILFYDKSGVEIKSHRLIGFVDPETFISHLAQVKKI